MKSNQLKIQLSAIGISTKLFCLIRSIQKLPSAFLFAQQLIDKLGDTKERIRDPALVALCELFITICTQQDNRKEITPHAALISKFESLIISKSFGSKIPKAREMVIKF